MNQNGYHPQGMQGYGQQGPAYPQSGINGQGYNPAQNGLMQQPQNYDGYIPPAVSGYNASPYSPQQGAAVPQNPYVPVMNQGYPPNSQQPGYGYEYQQPGQQNIPYQAGYQMPPQQNPSAASFIPQTPYSPGYTAPGYQPPQQNYQQGYNNPYAQMGRMPQQTGEQPDYNASIPLNGGGYVPQKVPVRRRKFEFRDWHLILLGAVLIALFIAAVLLTKNSVLKIILILFALGSAGVLWVKPLTAENKRLTYSILALALCVLTAVSFIMPSGNQANSPADTGKQISDEGNGSEGVPEIPENSVKAAEQPTPTAEVKDDSLMVRLVTFFKYWSENRQDDMLTLCAPSWVAKQENPRTSLFTLLANRFPKDCTPESITGTDADTSRKVTLTSTIDRGNGKEPEKYRMTVLMVKENNEWYMDPESLQTYDAVDTPDPSITDTPAPTETPVVYSDTKLYYNPKGGEYYHLDPYCRIINEKFTPLEGSFTYAEVNTEPYSNLKPCNVCGAPLRP